MVAMSSGNSVASLFQSVDHSKREVRSSATSLLVMSSLVGLDFQETLPWVVDCSVCRNAVGNLCCEHPFISQQRTWDKGIYI